jgi:hypothetical protein
MAAHLGLGLIDWALCIGPHGSPSWIGPRQSPMDFLKFIFSFPLRDKMTILVAIGFLPKTFTNLVKYLLSN